MLIHEKGIMIMFFVIVGMVLMPILGFLFVVKLLEAIKKIVNKQNYKVDMYWSGILFGIIVWTIAMCSLLPNL